MEQINPYKGIETYDLKDKAIFHGRDREIVDITNIILNNRSTILTGYSGCGKTSLLKAGVWPELDKYHYHLIYVTPNKFYKGKEREILFPIDFWNGVAEEIHKQCTNFNLECSHKTLLEEMVCEHPDKWYGNKHRFVVVLDQFEEFFQYNLNEKYKTLFFKIYDILSGNYNESLIENVYKEIEQNIYAYKKDLVNEGNMSNDKTLKNNVLPKSFKLITEESNRLVITIRKDFLYDLQIYSNRFPIIGKNINYIEYLDDDQASAVIVESKIFEKLAEKDKKALIKQILDIIIDKTDYNCNDNEPDYYVDTMMLSIIMYELWEQYPDADTLNTIKDKKLKEKLESIIYHFYCNRMNELKRRISRLVDDCKNEEVKNRIIKDYDRIISKIEKNLISEAGAYRRTIYTDEIRNYFDESVYGNIDFATAKDESNFMDVLKELRINEKDFSKFWDLLKKDAKKKSGDNKKKSLEISKEHRKEFDNCIYQSKKNGKPVIDSIIDAISDFSLFVTTFKDKQQEIELRHDRLCKYALHHTETIESLLKNVKRYTADVYFTPLGRLKHDNSFVECVFGPWNTDSAIQRTVFFMEGGLGDILDFNTEFVDNFMRDNNKGAKSVILNLDIKRSKKDVSPKKDEEDLDSPEIFSRFQLKVANKKIYEMSFFKGNNAVVLPSGYHKVVFYYDKFDRIIIKKFYKDSAKKVSAIIDNYDSISYVYLRDYHRLPDITYFTKELGNDIFEKDENDNYPFRDLTNEKAQDYFKGKSVFHSDDNSGYVSYYDDYGRETARFFLMENGNGDTKKSTKYGFDTIKFEREYPKDDTRKDIHNNLIKEISYYTNGTLSSYKEKEAYVNGADNANKNKTAEFFDFDKCSRFKYQGKVHKVKFEYDSKNRIENTYYYDWNDENVDLNGIYGEEYDFDFKIPKEDESGKPLKDEDGNPKYDKFILSTYKDKKPNEQTDSDNCKGKENKSKDITETILSDRHLKQGKKRDKRGDKSDNDKVLYALMHRTEKDENRIDWIEWRDENGTLINGRKEKVEGKEKNYCKIDFITIANNRYVRYMQYDKDKNVNDNDKNKNDNDKTIIILKTSKNEHIQDIIFLSDDNINDCPNILSKLEDNRVMGFRIDDYEKVKNELRGELRFWGALIANDKMLHTPNFLVDCDTMRTEGLPMIYCKTNDVKLSEKDIKALKWFWRLYFKYQKTIDMYLNHEIRIDKFIEEMKKDCNSTINSDTIIEETLISYFNDNDTKLIGNITDTDKIVEIIKSKIIPSTSQSSSA